MHWACPGRAGTGQTWRTPAGSLTARGCASICPAGGAAARGGWAALAGTAASPAVTSPAAAMNAPAAAALRRLADPPLRMLGDVNRFMDQSSRDPWPPAHTQEAAR